MARAVWPTGQARGEHRIRRSPGVRCCGARPEASVGSAIRPDQQPRPDDGRARRPVGPRARNARSRRQPAGARNPRFPALASGAVPAGIGSADRDGGPGRASARRPGADEASARAGREVVIPCAPRACRPDDSAPHGVSRDAADGATGAARRVAGGPVAETIRPDFVALRRKSPLARMRDLRGPDGLRSSRQHVDQSQRSLG